MSKAINFSTLHKSQWVRLVAIRQTIISRQYKCRMVERQLDTGDGFEGEFSFPLQGNIHAWVYIIDWSSKRGKIPMDYWAVKIADYEWEAAVKVDLKK